MDATAARRDFNVDTRIRGARLRAKPKQRQGGDSIRVVAKAGADEAVKITAKATVKAGKARAIGSSPAPI